MSYSPDPNKGYLTISLIAIFFMCLMMVSCTPAGATQPFASNVQDHYKNITVKTPYSEQVCYETRGDKSGDALMGAIIGGVIGNNITKNLPDGGTAGAIIGGILGHQNSDAVSGMKCDNITRYKSRVERVYSHSTIEFNYDGKSYIVRFNK